MTNVDFYLLPESSIIACDKSICRLIEKAYQQQHRIYLWVESEKMAQHFDSLLWTFSDTSFVPHNFYEGYLTSQIPIQIGLSEDPSGHNDILVNLTENILSGYLVFQKILEIIPSDEGLKAVGRRKYKFYKDNGCNLKMV
jgi:DNA polymerase III subunit chi